MNIKTNNTFKYDYTKLDPVLEEFKLVKGFFDITSTKLRKYNKFHNFQIYKIIEKSSTNLVKEKSNNLMLFHGTTEKRVIGILKEGFRNSEKGFFGKGVYMTDCSHMQLSKTHSFDPNKPECYFFVNEVLQSEKLQTFDFENVTRLKDVSTNLKNQFEKHMRKSSPQPAVEDYKKDVKGRLYRNIPFDIGNIFDRYVADASVTIPRYLITLELEELEMEDF